MSEKQQRREMFNKIIKGKGKKSGEGSKKQPKVSKSKGSKRRATTPLEGEGSRRFTLVEGENPQRDTSIERVGSRRNTPIEQEGWRTPAERRDSRSPPPVGEIPLGEKGSQSAFAEELRRLSTPHVIVERRSEFEDISGK
jgi:hypothetical protein